MGSGKTWYGVPRDAALDFEEVVRMHGYYREVNPLSLPANPVSPGAGRSSVPASNNSPSSGISKAGGGSKTRVIVPIAVVQVLFVLSMVGLAIWFMGQETMVMDWAIRVKVAAGAARGIAYLQEDYHPRIIHRIGTIKYKANQGHGANNGFDIFVRLLEPIKRSSSPFSFTPIFTRNKSQNYNIEENLDMFNGMKRRDLLLRRYWWREDDGTYGVMDVDVDMNMRWMLILHLQLHKAVPSIPSPRLRSTVTKKNI